MPLTRNGGAKVQFSFDVQCNKCVFFRFWASFVGENGSEALYVFYFFYLFQVVADGLEIGHVVHAEFDVGGEESVVRFYVYAVDVHVELLREDARYAVQNTHAVESDYV